MDVIKEIERLYRDRQAEFLRVAGAIVGGQDQALDVVHDAFVSCVRGAKTYRQTGTVEAWVWASVLNSARRALKKSSRDKRQYVRQLEDPRGSAAGESRAEIRTAVAQLPERQRLVLFLRYYADLDYETIARALGITAGTVGATLHAAHLSLRESLEQEVSFEL